ncbi:hypothetical protein WS67_05985 [Burkholderia singularis]|uniref:DUF1223 domain-containing protein n=1 Tax=Burkholderia singularis TaxID=1503053 RepID=A0A118DQ96_9BURK|nr:DUF1223 domain-containing protein [Burkholderia singularis]KVE29393.1 hypothetical protein WS67_05985 [Burkholderia singularis]
MLPQWLPVSMRIAVAALAFGAACAADAADAVCAARSGATRQVLVELYTSEGCSSCPGADGWLARLAAQRTALRVVPLALHVDYWDGLGWADRFAQHRFAERQAALAAKHGGGVVYTPEIAVAGREMRDWRDVDAFARRVAATAAQLARIGIALAAMPGPHALDVALSVLARDGAPRALNAYVALYENGLTSDVRAGENRGATLRHERVVRQWLGPLVSTVPAPAARLDVRRSLPYPDGWRMRDAARYGIVAFAEDAGTGEVLQAVDLGLCANSPATAVPTERRQ